MPYMVPNSYMGLGKEATYGTPASVGLWTPINSPKVTPNVKFLDDSDFRGSPVMHYDQVPGVRHDQFSGKCFMFTDVYPQLLNAVLGGTDTVASVGPSTWTHTIKLLNSPNTGSQPASYTVWNYSVDNTYQMAASRLVDMSLSFAADAAVETTFTFTGNAASVVGSVAVNESTQHLIPSWNCAASIGGTNVAVVEQATLDIKRGTAPIFTLGQQGPYNNFAGPIDVTGKITVVVEAGETYWANSLIRNEQQLILKFIDPASAINAYVQFTADAVQLENGVITASKNYLQIEADYTAVANAADSANGYAPLFVTVQNGISTQY